MKPDFFILVLDQVLQLGNWVFPVKNLPKVFLKMDFCPKPLCGNKILLKTLVWKWKSEKNTFGNGPGFFSMSPHWTRRREEMFFEIFELNSSIIKILSAERNCWRNQFFKCDCGFEKLITPWVFCQPKRLAIAADCLEAWCLTARMDQPTKFLSALKNLF